jgi:hypothetical protein
VEWSRATKLGAHGLSFDPARLLNVSGTDAASIDPARKIGITNGPLRAARSSVLGIA